METVTKKFKITPLRVNAALFLFCTAFILLFYLSKGILEREHIYYRSYIIVISVVITLLIMPLSLLALPITGVLNGFIHKSTASKVLSVLVCMAMTVLFKYYLEYGFLIYTFKIAGSIEKETLFTADIIEGTTEDETRFYERLSFFFKKDYEPLSDILEIKLGQKYGTLFETYKEDKYKEDPIVYRLYPVSNPELEVHAFCGRGIGGFSDDYSYILGNSIIKAEAALYGVAAEDDYKTIYYGGKLVRGSIITVHSKEDTAMAAQAAAEAVKKVLEDPFFRKQDHSAAISFNCLMPDGIYQEVFIQFGGKQILLSEKDYTDPSQIEKIIRQCYDEYAAAMEQQGVLEEETQVFEPDTGTPETVEGAYKYLYDTIFAHQSLKYETDYNAKGNFYGILSEGREKLNSETPEMDTRRTVVYDRISKNEKCHLFMDYETYYNQDGSEYTTAILNSYAVNRETGEVTPSGKHAWADTGSEAYREAAGEP